MNSLISSISCNSINFKSAKEILVDNAVALLNKVDSDDTETHNNTNGNQKGEIHTVISNVSSPESTNPQLPPPTNSAPFVASLWPFTSEASTINSTSTESKLGKVDEGVAGNGIPFMVPLWPFTSDTASGITNASTADSNPSADVIPSLEQQQQGQPFMVSLWPFTSETTSTMTDSNTTDTAVDGPPSLEQKPDNSAPFAVSLWPFVPEAGSAPVSTSTNLTSGDVVADNSTPFAVSLWPFTSETVVAAAPTNTVTPADSTPIDPTDSIVTANNNASNLFEIQNSLIIVSQSVEYISSAIVTNARNIVDISADATEFATMYVIENTPKLIETSADQVIQLSDQFVDTMHIVFDEDDE